MRSPYSSKGRNRRIENLWRTLTGYVRSLFDGAQRPLISLPRRRSVSLNPTARERNYDLEISEYPIRDAERARELIEMTDWCPEVATALDIIKGDVFSSSDGDDQGFALSETLIDGSAIDPEVYRVGTACLGRVLPFTSDQMAIERMLSYGDAFAEMAIDTAKNQVNSLMILPTWEMFRVEVQGETLGFEQRRQLHEQKADYQFAPAKIVHWRYRRKNLYGRSLWHESPPDWAQLKRATMNFGEAANALGVNSNIHVMPEGADAEYVETYRQGMRDLRSDGVVTDYYLLPGEEIRKLSTINPDLEALAADVLLWRSRIVMRSRVPPYLLGLPTVGARDIAGQPALAYARFINEIRGCFAEGVKQVLFTEFILKGLPEEQWRGIKLAFPKIVTNVFTGGTEANEAESETPGIEDTESLRMVYPVGATNGKHG